MIMRKMEDSDIPYCADIEMQSFGKRDVENFEKCQKNPNYAYYVMEENCIVCGYIGILFSVPDVELITIAVDQNKRRFGIGTKLLSGAIERAVEFGARQMFLEVNAKNNGAKLLYEKFRFVPISVRKKYYNGTDDAIIMKKIL